MTIIYALGTGSAFTMKGFQTNFLIQRNGKNLLVDCGSDARFSIVKHGFSYKDIDSVYISHAHADHAGGLEFLGFCTYFTPGCARPKLFAERQLMRDLWDHTLRGGMEGIEGIDCTLDTFFETFPITRNHSFGWEGLKFDIVQSVHISAKYSIVDSYGLMFTDDNGMRIYLTTDVQFAPETSMKAYYRDARLIVHDCETAYSSGVHAHYDSLKTLPPEIKRKILLTHYQDNVVDNFIEWQKKALDDGFARFIEPGCFYTTT
jgi:ribonuclease BN (tRNA processing enzyme)